MGAYFTDPETGYKFESALDSEDITATTNGLEIDTQGFDKGWCTFYVNVGTMTGAGGEIDIKLQETDVTGFGGTVTDVTGATFTKLEVDVAGTFDKAVAGTVLIHGRQRFLRLVFTETSAVTATPISAVAVLTGARESNLVDTAYDFSVTS